MGGTQSRRRDSYSQTPPVEYRKAHVEEPLGLCTTFNEKLRSFVPKATIQFSLNNQPPAKPPQKRRKYDRTYTIRNRRTLLPIREENIDSQHTADAATNERTQSKGFPSFSELRDSMRRKKTVKRPDDSENFELEVHNNTELPKPEIKENKKEICVDSIAAVSSVDKDEATDNEEINYYEFDFDFSNEKLFEDIDEDDGDEAISSQLNYCSDSVSHSPETRESCPT